MTLRGLGRALGAVPDGDLEALASVVFGAQCECAMTIAHAEDPRPALAAALRQLGRLLDAVAVSSRPAAGGAR